MTFKIDDCSSLVSKSKPKMSQSESVQVSVRLSVIEWYNLQLVQGVEIPRCGGNIRLENLAGHREEFRSCG